MRSIRALLVNGTIGTMVVLLAASGVFLFLMVRTSLLRQFDRALMDKAAVLMGGVEVKSGHVVFDDEDIAMDEFLYAGGPGYLDIRTMSDKTIYRSPSLEDSVMQPVGTADGHQIQQVALPGGRSGRAVSVDFPPRVDDEDRAESGNLGTAFSGGVVRFVFARDTAPVMDTLRQLEFILFAFGAGTIVLAGTLLRMVIQRALKPLDTLAADINRIGADDLSKTISASECPIELKPVVDRLNDLLARLNRAFDRERGFSADVAHKLRTPLAGIRSTLEVTLSRQRCTPEYESAFKQCLEIAGDMQIMVENLLMLARLDSGEFEIVPEEIGLDSLVASVLAPLRPLFAARNIDVQLDAEKNIALESDATLLQIVARNLLDNALSYTNEGGWTTVETQNAGTNAIFRVTNSGSRIATNQIDNLFDRFWRADTSRTDTGTHCGLGLSLVKKIVTTLGGTVEVTSTDGGNFAIAVAIPKRRHHE